MADKVQIFAILITLVIIVVIVASMASRKKKDDPIEKRPVSGKTVQPPKKFLGKGIDDEGDPIKVYSNDPYIAPKTFEVGLIKTDCRTADSCHNKLVSRHGSNAKTSLCNPGALYPINGLGPEYSKTDCPKSDCAFSQFIRSP